jgi:hypothetical protein
VCLFGGLVADNKEEKIMTKMKEREKMLKARVNMECSIPNS